MGKLPSGHAAKASAPKTAHKGLMGKFTAPKASKPGYLLVVSSNHNALNQRARQAGATVAARFAVGGKTSAGGKTLAAGKTSAGGKIPAVFTPGLKSISLDRVADQPDATFNRVWRDLLAGHDELFSTSLARETLKGFLSVRPSAALSSAERAGLTRLMNLVSDARIPTRFAGSSTAGRLVQHPTGETGGGVCRAGHRERACGGRSRPQGACGAGHGTGVGRSPQRCRSHRAGGPDGSHRILAQ